MAPISGVIQIKGDITRESTANQIIDSFGGGKAELVVCDGAPDVTGLHDLDEYVQAQLLFAVRPRYCQTLIYEPFKHLLLWETNPLSLSLKALNITTHLLADDGTFVAKIFKGKDIALMYAQFKSFFKFVEFVKPSSSRSGSIEAFLVCKHYQAPPGFVPTLINPISNMPYSEDIKLAPLNQELMPYTSTGDLTGFDSFVKTDLPVDEEFDAILSGAQSSSP